MRIALLTAGLAVCLFGTLTAATTTPARADEWCGFKDKEGAPVRCGYSSLQECKQFTGAKDSVCMPDPGFALREERRARSTRPA
ncbi:MAG TPA: DUF3551 domain-containing protein [Pseudolabrys sp.]|nr:DUF3551 domain-containing protein [Pseudolabrys sp.]